MSYDFLNYNVCIIVMNATIYLYVLKPLTSSLVQTKCFVFQPFFFSFTLMVNNRQVKRANKAKQESMMHYQLFSGNNFIFTDGISKL